MTVNTLVIHPVSYALAASNGAVSLVQGPFTPKPVITTGAGDHFNSGFCLGKLLGLDNAQCRPDRRHHQRPLRPHRAKSRHPGPGKNAPVLAERRK